MPSNAELEALMARGGRPGIVPLSAQQLEVLRLLSNGLRFSDIARQRGMHVEAVKDSARVVRQKLAAKTLPHARSLSRSGPV